MTVTRNRRITYQTNVILADLLKREAKASGLEVSRATDIKWSVIAPVLTRFEDRGWVVSELREAGLGSFETRFYELTPLGRQEARGKLARS